MFRTTGTRRLARALPLVAALAASVLLPAAAPAAGPKMGATSTGEVGKLGTIRCRCRDDWSASSTNFDRAANTDATVSQ